MNGFFGALRTSFETLLTHPKLFLPKILITFLYSVPVLFLPSLAIGSFAAPSLEIFNALVFFLFFTLGVSVLDTMVSAMYPFLVSDYFAGTKISLKKSFSFSLKKVFLVVPAVMLVEILFLAAAIMLAFPFALFVISENYFGIAAIVFVSLALIFFIGVFFYMIYPVTALEKTGVLSSLKRSVFISKKNFSLISKAAVFSLALSVLSIVFSFAIEFFGSKDLVAGSVVSFLLFVVVRFVTALIATYQYVLNPVFYLGIEKKGVF